MLVDIGVIIGVYSFTRLALMLYPATPGHIAPPWQVLFISLALIPIAALTADLFLQGISPTETITRSTLR